MIEVKGAKNSAIAFLEELDKSAEGQLKAMCDQDFLRDSKIRIMPDAHGGAGCVIGTTMTVTDKITPNFVGVDIGCGMETVNIGHCRIDFNQLDNFIRQQIPSGMKIRKTPHRFAEETGLDLLSHKGISPIDRALLSIGTLGGGNHFIEIDRDEESGEYYLVIHSGSRNMGLQVANWHQKKAQSRKIPDVPPMLAYLEGELFADYVNDMKIMQEYAKINRKAIADDITRAMKWKVRETFTTIHNYLDTDNMILRKGAVSAQKGEKLLIPMNMRDGALICEGLGNPDWNYSAPHGAGRLYSRTEAKNRLSVEEFKKEMAGIYTTCVHGGTIDESPMAYKPMEAIINQIGPTVNVLKKLKPVYNFKAS